MCVIKYLSKNKHIFYIIYNTQTFQSDTKQATKRNIKQIYERNKKNS